jgi:acetyl esterase/lipase
MTKREQKLIELIRRVHGLVDSPDIEKKRQSQEQWGAFLGNSKEITYQEFTIDEMPAEWVGVNRPHVRRNVILYCHGGGYSTGSTKYARTITSKLALNTSMDVLAFDYRLAPENPYPAALEDCLKVWNYLMLLGYGARDIVVAGDSAGGNMALVLVHKLKEEGRMLPGGLVLFSPWTDMTCSGESFMGRKSYDPVLTPEYLYQIRADYVRDEKYENPYASPLYGDFSDFPPTLIQVGENEILYSDSSRLRDEMEKQRVPVSFEEYDKMWHVFQMSPVKKAQEAVESCAEFICKICR